METAIIYWALFLHTGIKGVLLHDFGNQTRKEENSPVIPLP